MYVVFQVRHKHGNARALVVYVPKRRRKDKEGSEDYSEVAMDCDIPNGSKNLLMVGSGCSHTRQSL